MSIAECNATLPENLNRIIRERGLKQNAVAQWAGFTSQQFTAMLNGRKLIKPCDAAALANALGINVGDLFENMGQSSA